MNEITAEIIIPAPSPPTLDELFNLDAQSLIKDDEARMKIVEALRERHRKRITFVDKATTPTEKVAVPKVPVAGKTAVPRVSVKQLSLEGFDFGDEE